MASLSTPQSNNTVQSKPNKLSKAQLKNLEVAAAINACGGKIRAESRAGYPGRGARRYYGYRSGKSCIIHNHLGQAVLSGVGQLVEPYI